MDHTASPVFGPPTVKAYPDWQQRMAKNYAPPRRGVWEPMLPYTYSVPPIPRDPAVTTP